MLVSQRAVSHLFLKECFWQINLAAMLPSFLNAFSRTQNSLHLLLLFVLYTACQMNISWCIYRCKFIIFWTKRRPCSEHVAGIELFKSLSWFMIPEWTTHVCGSSFEYINFWTMSMKHEISDTRCQFSRERSTDIDVILSLVRNPSRSLNGRDHFQVSFVWPSTHNNKTIPSVWFQ